MKYPLFLCGPANCGTNLVKAILGVNEKVHLESEPFLPLFQFLRTSIIKKFKKNTNLKFDEPLFEYYFSKKIDVLNRIQKSNLNIKIKNKDLLHLKKKIKIRMRDYVPHLIKDINLINGKTYKEIFNNAIQIIDKNHKKEKIKWLGWMDSWFEEFIPILAKEYKNSKFILIIRDPRASITSYQNGFKKINKSNHVPLTLSYLRCWRKQVAFAEYFKSKDFLKERIITIKYEELVKNPKLIIKKMCKFLKISYSKDMLDTTKFMGIGKNIRKWKPNSNFKSPSKGIYKKSLNRWKSYLNHDLRNFIEFIVGPELKYLDYQKKQKKFNNQNIFKLHSKEYKQIKGWRTTKNHPITDIKYEIFRNELIGKKNLTNDVVRNYFLFEQIFKRFKRI